MDATTPFAAVEPFSLEADWLTPTCCFVDTSELGESFPEPVRSAIFAADEWAEAVVATLQGFLDDQHDDELSEDLRDQLSEAIEQLTTQHQSCDCSQFSFESLFAEVSNELQRLRAGGVAGWYFEGEGLGTASLWAGTSGQRSSSSPFDGLVEHLPRAVRETSWERFSCCWDGERLAVAVRSYRYGRFESSLRALNATQWGLLYRLATEQRYGTEPIVAADGTELDGVELVLKASPGALGVLGPLLDLKDSEDATLVELLQTLWRRQLLDMSDELGEIVGGLLVNWPLSWDDLFDAAIGACLGPLWRTGPPVSDERRGQLVAA